jgi:hypothetical protein
LFVVCCLVWKENRFLFVLPFPSLFKWGHRCAILKPKITFIITICLSKLSVINYCQERIFVAFSFSKLIFKFYNFKKTKTDLFWKLEISLLEELSVRNRTEINDVMCQWIFFFFFFFFQSNLTYEPATSILTHSQTRDLSNLVFFSNLKQRIWKFINFLLTLLKVIDAW